MSPISSSLPALFLLLSLTSTPSSAQTVTPDGCLRLSGSNACPGFSTAYVHPSNLSNAFPFFEDVTDVPSFDAGVFRYLSDPNQYRQTKFVEQLGCSNSSGTTLRYARTVLCSSWVNSRWSINCFDLYNRSDVATGPKMICQDSCIAMSQDEQRIVDNPEFCPGPDLTGGLRNTNITKDFVQCTNWTTLASNNSETCVEGDTNEGNCGYGSSTNQLCSFCNASSPDSCCYGDNTDLTSCGYTLAALPSSTGSGGSNEGEGSSGGSGGLSGGQIAGIVVGSVLGGLLAIGLLLWLLMFCGVLPICGYGRRKHRDKRASSQFGNNASDSHYQRPATANNAALLSATPDSGEGSVDGPQMTQLTRGGTGAMSSRTMFGGTSVLSADKPNGYAVAPVGLGKPMSVAGSETTAQKQRALLSSVRDENQSGEHLILPNSTVTVLWPYSAALPDELSLSPGMKLVVLRIYDDAWGTGQVVSGNEGDIGRQGAFPLVCVTENNTASEGSYSGSVDGGTGGMTRSTSGQALSESQSARDRRY